MYVKVAKYEKQSKNYYNVGTVSEIHRKIVERGNISMKKEPTRIRGAHPNNLLQSRMIRQFKILITLEIKN